METEPDANAYDSDQFNKAEDTAKKTVSELEGAGIPERPLTTAEIEKLSDVVLEFCQQMTGINFFPYEQEFGWRIIFSLLIEDADEITTLFSRQSGKTETVADIVVGCMVIFPILATVLVHDERITKFKEGLWCGIYAPNYEQAGIMWARMKLRMYSKQSKNTLLDPDINIDLEKEKENMTLPNGSFCDCGTASPQATIEGKTYHLILLEECQDISASKIRSEIHPMGAATAGTIVKIGTPNRKKSEFYYACRRNKRNDINNGVVRARKRLHFEFDYTICQRFNKRYQKYVKKEMGRLGEDSDDFKMKYKLQWLLERGMFVNPDVFEECGIKTSGEDLVIVKNRGRRKVRYTFVRPPNVVNFDTKTPDLVFSVDVGRENSTVVTIGKVFWDCPVMYAGQERYPIHVYNWLELQGDDHEAQHPQILAFLKNYRLSQGIVDATGKGDPVYSRLAADLDKFGIYVKPFIFGSTSKDLGYKVLGQEIATRRITYPSGSQVTKYRKWKRFVSQMVDLEKEWRGQTLVVHKPKDDPDNSARDDYPDSLMMLCFLVNVSGSMEVEEQLNPFVGRLAKWAQAEMMRQAGAWYRSATVPPSPGSRGKLRETRPGKRGQWD